MLEQTVHSLIRVGYLLISPPPGSNYWGEHAVVPITPIHVVTYNISVNISVGVYLLVHFLHTHWRHEAGSAWEGWYSVELLHVVAVLPEVLKLPLPAHFMRQTLPPSLVWILGISIDHLIWRRHPSVWVHRAHHLRVRHHHSESHEGVHWTHWRHLRHLVRIHPEEGRHDPTRVHLSVLEAAVAPLHLVLPPLEAVLPLVLVSLLLGLLLRIGVLLNLRLELDSPDPGVELVLNRWFSV